MLMNSGAVSRGNRWRRWDDCRPGSNHCRMGFARADASNVPFNFPGDGSEIEDLFGGPQADGFAGHSENDASGFALRDGGSPVMMEVQKADRAVFAHAGHEHAD